MRKPVHGRRDYDAGRYLSKRRIAESQHQAHWCVPQHSHDHVNTNDGECKLFPCVALMRRIINVRCYASTLALIFSDIPLQTGFLDSHWVPAYR
jgi:hypothetical protein